MVATETPAQPSKKSKFKTKKKAKKVGVESSRDTTRV